MPETVSPSIGVEEMEKKVVITLIVCPKCAYYHYPREDFVPYSQDYCLPKHRHWRKKLEKVVFYSIEEYIAFLQQRFQEKQAMRSAK